MEVLERLYTRIENASIWIPCDEVYKQYFGKRNGRIDKIEEPICRTAGKHSDSWIRWNFL